MMKGRYLFVGGFVLVIGLLLVACGPQATQAPPTNPPQVVPTTAPVSLPATQAPSAVPPMAAPTKAPPPPQSVIQIRAIGPEDGITYVDAATKDEKALTTTGLKNVPIGVPVFLQAAAINLPKGATAKSYAWTLKGPDGSKAALEDATAEKPTYTPDVVGPYKLTLTATDSNGNATKSADLTMSAGTFVGNGGLAGDTPKAPQCAACHADKVKGWLGTGHATMFSQAIDGKKSNHYSGDCISCHTVGYNTSATAVNGGFDDIAAKLGWKFPDTAADPKALKPGNWDALPAELKNLANIQCESCHGPGSQHSGNPAGIDSSLSAGVCDQCHAEQPYHRKGLQLANSKHADVDSQAFTYPIGQNNSQCVRCHSGAGYVDFTKNPTDNTKWRTTYQPVTCGVCHDPHEANNPFQLRVYDNPVQIPIDLKGVGLSATCTECHNSRTTAKDLLTAKNPSFPHYSSATELVYGQGGFDFGVTLTNSPHGKVVGAAPMKAADGKTDLFGGKTPGACVACHMYSTPGTDKSNNPLPGHDTIGEHSFAMTDDKGNQNVAACQSCHQGLTTFDRTVDADYDGNGKIEGAQTEISGLLKRVRDALVQSGVKEEDGYPYFSNITTDAQKEAIYNYRTVYGVMGKYPEGGVGKAAAIHNFKRSAQLLQLAYKALTGNDVPNAAIIK